MSGASIAAMLEEWASSLREGKGRLGPLFRRERMAASAGLFVDGLLGPERRRTGGCAPRRRVIAVLGAGRPCWAGRSGRRTRFAMWCAAAAALA
jgi:hypothetical protein